MQSSDGNYAHVLLFACPLCGRPLASACFNTKKSLEDADAHWFNPHCHCGWTGEVTGMLAIKQWVEAWPRPVRWEDELPGACEGQSHNQPGSSSEAV
jgi:hypothetical protein